jgi:hypothetical protein
MQKWTMKHFKTSKPEPTDVWQAVDLYSDLVDELIKLGKLEV